MAPALGLIAALILLALAVLGLGGCAGQGPAASGGAPRDTSPDSRAAPAPQSVQVLLALPLGNAYATFANRVALGAQTAVARLARSGVRVDLQLVDTARPDWLSQVSGAHPSAIIGGPMLAQDVPLMLTLQPQRVFFAMLPEFPPGLLVEGRDAWRFFTSPADHIETVLTAARDSFGIQDVGVLYPQEAFGQRRAQLFDEIARSMGLHVKASTNYAPDDPLQWNKQVASFLEQGYAATTPGSRHPGMEAVFLPDVWSQAQMLAPLFGYYQEDHMLLLGSALWDQTLAMRPEDAQAFRLAIFPSAWWDANPAPEARALVAALGGGKADYWHAVGYDFVRFASHFGPMLPGVKPDRDFQQINQRLHAAQQMPWSMAPIRWNIRGVATQRLFLFSPTPSGPEPAKLEVLKARFAEAARNYRIRMNGAP
ncbi:type 1 periplasmic-binding domain-containing protein [Megalodesulfovibrio paquesii]